jgi:hypothetical protein
VAKPSPRVFDQIAREHLRRLDRLAERGSAARLKGLYERAFAEMERKARHLMRGQSKDSFSAHHARQVMAQLKAGIRTLALNLTGDTTAYAQEAAREARSATIRNIRRLEEHYAGTTPVLPAEEAARFIGAAGVSGPTSLLRDASRHGLLPGRVQTSMARYGARMIGRFEEELAQSTIQGETVGEAIDRIQDTGDLLWWEAERIARTETAWAYSAASADAIDEADQLMRVGGEDGVYMRWSEHISDETGLAYDDRVAADSFAMHGQVSAPGQSFVMPPYNGVDSRRWGMTFEFPPNRPNDRAALTPWRAHWGVRGWRWVGGRRENIR